MTEEDPLSIVQVRYARGEIDTAEYEEFLSWFLKNIALQQVPSLKIASERYANGEISIGQYKEILSHLITDISNYQQSAPLRIVHMRYAEGEIITSEFEEKISVLMKDIPTYPHSPPLAVLFTRYAKGEIDNAQYKEMLSHLATYLSPSLPKQENIPPVDPEKKEIPPSKPDVEPPVKKPVTISSPAKPPEPTSSPDPYRLNFAAMQNAPSQKIMSADTLSAHSELGGELQSDEEIHDIESKQELFNEHPVELQDTGDSTVKNDRYHITDVTSPLPPVTIVVKQDTDSVQNKAINSLKQNIQEGKNLKKKADLFEKKEPDFQIEEEKKAQIITNDEHQNIKALIKQGKYQEAITRLDELLKQTPNDYRSLFLKSISLFNIGKGDEALTLLSNAKESCTNKEDEKEIERIYNHIIQKENEKKTKKENEQESEREKITPDKTERKSTFSGNMDLTKFKYTEEIQKIGEEAQKLIDDGNFSGANDTLSPLSDVVKEIPLEIMQKESIDELFAAKGFVLYQLKEFCEAKKFFKEATKINPKNDTAMHYLNDIRVRDCNKFVRHV